MNKNKKDIIRAAYSSPFWSLMTKEEKLEYLEDFEARYSESRRPLSVKEAIRFGTISDYI